MKEASLTRLTIRNAEFYAYHGVKSEERKLGGKYQVDLDMWYNATNAIINDDVKYAVNYEEAMFCIAESLNKDTYFLVETILSEILSMVMEKFPEVMEARAVVRKVNVPIRRVVDYIEVEQSVKRQDG